MTRTDRILIGVIMLCLSIMCLIITGQNQLLKRRVGVVEIRLQNHEHLLSLALSESRSPALTNRIDGLRNDTNAPRKRADAEIK